MTDLELRERMMERLLAAQTPWGRFRLTLYVTWKRLAWQGVIRGTLLLLAPVFLTIAILVKLDGGPIFFRQTRIGLLGREFKMLKFRSMVVDAEARLKELLARNEKASGVTFKMKDDPRITKVGRFIRKSSLDELPQFWNVLKCEMSLVGPRPPVPRKVALYSQADRRRFLAKPGITCLWQVGEREGRLFEIGDRNQIDFPEQVALSRQDVWFDAANPVQPEDPLHLFGNPASGLAHPLYVNTELVGVVSVGRFTRQHPFTAGQVNIIHTFADFLGIQLRNARIQEEHLSTRLVTRELEIAATIQRSLLPVRLPEPDGFRLAGFCESASKVGGDYFDAVQVPNAGLLLVIADVMGKGVPAAMFAAIFRSHVHARPDLAIRPGEFLTWLNRALYPDLDRVEMFVTAQVVFLDQTTRTLRIASAGHCPLLVRDAFGEISEINADGPPLGIDADLEFGEHSLSVEAGMRFLMYTDGLIEARNPAGDLLGLDRLKSWFGSRDLDFASVAQIESGLVRLARDFQGSAPAADDLTFVVMADDPTAGLTKDGSSGNLHMVY